MQHAIILVQCAMLKCIYNATHANAQNNTCNIYLFIRY